MGKNFARKALCMILALSLVLGTAAIAFGASSPSKKIIPKKTADYVQSGASTVDMIRCTNTKAKTLTYDCKIKYNGKWYKLNKINANVFSKNKKLKTIKIKGTKAFKVDKAAFKGLSKKQLKKIKVRVTKKMSKAEFKKLKAQFKAAGIKAKNIKRVKKI